MRKPEYFDVASSNVKNLVDSFQNLRPSQNIWTLKTKVYINIKKAFYSFKNYFNPMWLSFQGIAFIAFHIPSLYFLCF